MTVILREIDVDAAAKAILECAKNAVSADYLRLVVPLTEEMARKAVLSTVALAMSNRDSVSAIVENTYFLAGVGTSRPKQWPPDPHSDK